MNSAEGPTIQRNIVGQRVKIQRSHIRHVEGVQKNCTAIDAFVLTARGRTSDAITIGFVVRINPRASCYVRVQ